ncbi:MAG: HisA/HisF-related TIM barrel protein [Rhodoferax sp.]|nr:HisA/HisF-related TIM barrel protein [Rhodoferax sp.]
MSVQFCCLARNHGEIVPAVPTLVHYTPALAVGFTSVARAGVVLGAESEAVATSLLAAGISKVFVGEAALRNAGVVDRLLKRFGAARLGLHVPVQRQAVSWSFDTVSNADFRVVTPSLCEPGWEVLKADGAPSGIRASVWIDAMLRRGVQSVLLRADMGDDTDLNLCAGMVETLGSKLWIAPLHDPAPAIADWISYGQATQLALPDALYRRRHELLPRANKAGTATLTAEQRT